MILWLFSLALEAVLALLYRRKGGFPAFRRFLWADIIGQAVEIADIQFLRGAGYPWVLFAGEIIAGVLLGFVVAECFEWRSKGARKLLLISALVAIPAHLLLAVPAWSPAGSLLLWSVALSHSVMGILLALMLITARRFRWHDAILSAWMLGTAVLFYAAPSFAAGYSVLWLNAGTWAALIAASLPSAPLSLTSRTSRAASFSPPRRGQPGNSRLHRGGKCTGKIRRGAHPRTCSTDLRIPVPSAPLSAL